MAELIEFIKPLGLINALYMAFFYTYCCLKNKEFRPGKDTLCYCGTTKKTGAFYNASLIASSMFQTAFLLALFELYPVPYLARFDLLVVTGGIGLAMAGIVSYNVSHLGHRLAGYVGVVFGGVGALFFQIALLSRYPLEGIVGLALICLLAIGSLGLLWKYKECAIPEIYYLAIVFVWNLFFTYRIYFRV